MRPQCGTLLVLLAGCAAGPGVSERPLGAPVPELLATPDGSSTSVLEQAGQLALEERYGEALAAVEAELARRPEDAALRLCRAGLLRDLGRRAEAAAALRQLAGGRRSDELHPSLLLAWAMLEWLEGRPEQARALLLGILAHHADDPWLQRHRGLVADLQRELDLPGDTAKLPPRDLLGELRGAADPARRRQAYSALLHCGPEQRARAAAIASVDPDAGLRATAIALVELPADALAELCARALQDPAGEVRGAAGRRAEELAPETAAGLLLPALENEVSAPTFEALHASLARVLPPGPPLLPGAAATAAGRRLLIRDWRQRCAK